MNNLKREVIAVLMIFSSIALWVEHYSVIKGTFSSPLLVILVILFLIPSSVYRVLVKAHTFLPEGSFFLRKSSLMYKLVLFFFGLTLLFTTYPWVIVLFLFKFIPPDFIRKLNRTGRYVDDDWY